MKGSLEESMIRLYRDASKFKAEGILSDNESFFLDNVPANSLGKDSLRVMESIDHAKLLDANIGTIVTPYGLTSIDNLSTGCKTVLNCIFIHGHNKEYDFIKAVNATGCGWNALEELFKLIERCEYDMGIILEHRNKLLNCSDREYLVDDRDVIETLFEF